MCGRRALGALDPHAGLERVERLARLGELVGGGAEQAQHLGVLRRQLASVAQHAVGLTERAHVLIDRGVAVGGCLGGLVERLLGPGDDRRHLDPVRLDHLAPEVAGVVRLHRRRGRPGCRTISRQR